jgi:hypothetical protein
VSGKSIKKRSRGVKWRGWREGGKFNMYEKMHDATGARERSQGAPRLAFNFYNYVHT